MSPYTMNIHLSESDTWEIQIRREDTGSETVAATFANGSHLIAELAMKYAAVVYAEKLQIKNIDASSSDGRMGPILTIADEIDDMRRQLFP